MTPLAKLTDARLMERIQDMAASCERIVAMSEDERKATGKDGSASPEQFGVIQAHLVLAFWNEARRRGLVDEDL